MVIVYGIIIKRYVVDVIPYTSTGNNIPEETGWANKVEKCNNVSTTMSVKLDVDGLLYKNIPLKYVTKVDILNRMYSDPIKKRKCCDNIINKYTKKKFYKNNDMHARIDTKI